jgi:tetratricopeptide (TPR) repeat protein
MVTIAQAFESAVGHHQAGSLQEAERIYRLILQAEPGHVDAHHLLGVLALQTGRHAEAVRHISAALKLKPDFAEAHSNLGNALSAMNRLPDALEHFQQAVRLQPGVAEMHNNLGNVLRALGRLPESLEQFEEALRLRPAFAEVHNNLGAALFELGRLPEAREHFEQAVRFRPDYGEAHLNLGNVLKDLDRLPEAEVCFREAARLRPGDAAAHTNLGNAVREQGRMTEALAQFARAVEVEPDCVMPHWNRATIYLLQGDLARGWPEYEWRLRLPSRTDRGFSQPRWDGGALQGRTILLCAEQGLGDTIEFIRYAPLVKQKGGTVLFECQPALVRLLSGVPGVDRLIPQGSPLPAFDVYCPLLSLPLLLGTTVETIPRAVPYLRADERLVEHWQRELECFSGFRVGIVWQGDPRHVKVHRRSLPLEHFEPLARLSGVHLLSLQKGPGCEQIAQLDGRFTVTDLGARLDEASGPFMDTAAVMKNLDLVVTADTAIGHLAGALGVPVWLALWSVPDWRWMLEREDSPWYPTARLFRQTQRGDWPGVFERMARALEPLLDPAPRTRPIAIGVSPGELIDKITILQIKSRRMVDPSKRRHVRAELTALEQVARGTVEPSQRLDELTAALKAVNETLWQVEDEIRDCERCQDFGPRFVALARSVYRQNDHRAALKRQINELLGSELVEEKAYRPYE